MRSSATLGKETTSTIPIFLILTSFIFFFVAQSSLWAFIERIGVSVGLGQAFIASTLAISGVVGLAGALAASILDIKFGRAPPIVLAAVVQLICLATLTGNSSSIVYLVALSLFQVFWSFALPYQFGVIISRDPSGRFVVLALTFQGVGATFSPALAGLAAAYGYAGVNTISAAAIVLYLALILPQSRTLTLPDSNTFKC